MIWTTLVVLYAIQCQESFESWIGPIICYHLQWYSPPSEESTQVIHCRVCGCFIQCHNLWPLQIGIHKTRKLSPGMVLQKSTWILLRGLSGNSKCVERLVWGLPSSSGILHSIGHQPQCPCQHEATTHVNVPMPLSKQQIHFLLVHFRITTVVCNIRQPFSVVSSCSLSKNTCSMSSTILGHPHWT